MLEAARREQLVYTWRGSPLACVSVEAVAGDWSLERLLSERLYTRTSYSTTSVGQVLEVGLSLLPTFDFPHYDVVLREASEAEVAKLMSIVTEPVRNPYRRRG